MNNSKENSYIVFKNFARKTMFGENVSLPALTILYDNEHIIFKDLKPIMLDSCENCYNYMARNNDDKGLIRGELTQKIIRRLSKSRFERQEDYNNQWDKIWSDTLCNNYKRADHEDYWLWNHAFYNAPIYDLEYIYNLTT